jgi:hypothetical protein
VAESLRTTDHKLIYIVTALTLLDEAEETKRQDSVPSTETTRILELIRNKALKIKHKLA